MKIPYDHRFAEQRREYRFVFTCENCRYYSLLRGECLHEYPNMEHRAAHYDPENPPREILFCKEFELI